MPKVKEQELVERSVARPRFARPSAESGRALSMAVHAIYALCSVTTGLAMLGRLAAYDAIGSRPVLMAGLLVLGLCIIAIPFTAGRILRWADRLWLLAAMGIIFMLVVVAPRYKIEASSDQGDCIIVAAGRLGGGLWPYDAASLWSHNPLSCGPGWVLLHMPLLAALSYPLTMLALIGLSFAVIAACVGWRRMSRFVVLLALIPGFWQCLGNRIDFPTFAVVLAALAAVGQSAALRSAPVRFLATPVLVLVSHFRLPFLLIPTIQLAGGASGKLVATVVLQAISLSLWFAFYFYDPESFTREGPMHVVGKFTSLQEPEYIAILLIFGSFLSIFLLRFLARFMDADHLLLFYITIIIFPISVQNVFKGAGEFGWSLALIQNWEGLSWLTGAACFAAWVFSAREFPADPQRRWSAIKREEDCPVG